jgi:hypothetical protein
MRLISSAQASPIRAEPQPASVGSDVKRVCRAAAVGGRVGERPDRLEHLDHGARPAVGDDDRQRVLVPRLDVDEVDVHAVDLRLELR